MATENWGYTAIDSTGKVVATADTYEALKSKFSVSDCIYHHHDEESGPKITTTIVIDEPKDRQSAAYGIVAKSLGKSISEFQRML